MIKQFSECLSIKTHDRDRKRLVKIIEVPYGIEKISYTILETYCSRCEKECTMFSQVSYCA